MDIHYDIVPRPRDVDTGGLVVTPEGLADEILRTALTGAAVRFTTDTKHFRRLRPRILTLCRQRGLKASYVSERPHARQHRIRKAPYTVVMWAERI